MRGEEHSQCSDEHSRVGGAAECTRSVHGQRRDAHVHGGDCQARGDDRPDGGPRAHATLVDEVLPPTAVALAVLEDFTALCSTTDEPAAAGEELDAVPRPAYAANIAAARQAAQEAHAIADPAERAVAEADAAARLALTGDPGLLAEAVTIARHAAEEARGISDPDERAWALGNAAMAFVLAGEPGLAAEYAADFLTAAAASRLHLASGTQAQCRA
jgi:hypothetical protein